MKNLCRIHFHIALKIFLLIGYALFFLVSIQTGTVNLYVHPRMIPCMIFAAAAMILIACCLFKKLRDHGEKKVNSWPLFFYIIPLIMALFFPAKLMNSSTGSFNDIQLSSGDRGAGLVANALQETTAMEAATEGIVATEGIAATEGAAATEGIAATEAAAATKGAAATDTEYTTKTSDTVETGYATESNDPDGISLINGRLVISSENYYACLCAIYADMDQYAGTPVELVGFVYKENAILADNEFIPARLMMVCCAADMQPVGLLCRYDQASELEIDSWVKVDGTIEITAFNGETIPYIAAQVVTDADEPENAYIYPY